MIRWIRSSGLSVPTAPSSWTVTATSAPPASAPGPVRVTGCHFSLVPPRTLSAYGRDGAAGAHRAHRPLWKTCFELGGVLVGLDPGHLGLGGVLDGGGLDPGDGLRPPGGRVAAGELVQVAAHAVAVAGLVERGQHAEELVRGDLEAAGLPVPGVEDVGVRAAPEGDDARGVSGGDELGLAG